MAQATRKQQLAVLVEVAGDALGKEASKIWDADVDLQDEFGGSFDAYLAYCTADLSGLVSKVKAASGCSRMTAADFK